MTELKHRLVRYAALAAAIPAASASGAIVWSGPGFVGIATPGSPVLVDLGPGIGEVFRFEVGTDSIVGSFPSSTYTSNSYTYFFPGGFASLHGRSAVFQFNPGNSGGVGDPGFMAPALLGFPNDPRRLSFGASINAGQNFYPMTTTLGTSHDLARSTVGFINYSTGYVLNVGDYYGDWQKGERGYIGFNIEVNGADTFGWLDVEWHPDGGARGVPTLIVNGWAYNDTPRGPIKAGEVPAPGAGGLVALAMGAAGLRRIRRPRP